MNKIIHKKILPAFLMLFILQGLFFNISYAQQDLTIYNMQSIPQSSYTNPAFKPIPEYKFYIGFPALSSFYLGVGNTTGLKSKNNIIRRDDDSLSINFDNFVDKLKKRNFLSLQLQEEILSFGFRQKKNYFSFSLTEKFFAHFSYPKDLMLLLWKGNGQFVGKTADFKGIGLNAMHYREYAVGMSHEINNRLTVGARGKLLFGKLNVNSKKTEISLYTDENTYDLTANSNILINTSIPEAMFEDSLDFDAGNYIMNTKNKGLAIDLGACYKLNNKFTFSASVIDLGYIKWKSDVKNYYNDNVSFTFEGFDIGDMLKYDTIDFDDVAEELLDSLADIFEIKDKSSSYSTMLNTKIYLSGVYNLTSKDRIGALIRTEFFNRAVHTALTLSYNRQFGKILNLSGSYSMRNRNYGNLGLGFALNLGSFQFYLISDNILGPLIYDKYSWTEEHDEYDDNGNKTVSYEEQSIMFPSYSRYMNVHFGINFIFGYRGPKKNTPSLTE